MNYIPVKVFYLRKGEFIEPMSKEQYILLEVMQEACSHGERKDMDLTALLNLITEKLAPVMKPE